jgi:hypothetical protein
MGLRYSWDIVEIYLARPFLACATIGREKMSGTFSPLASVAWEYPAMNNFAVTLRRIFAWLGSSSQRPWVSRESTCCCWKKRWTLVSVLLRHGGSRRGGEEVEMESGGWRERERERERVHVLQSMLAKPRSMNRKFEHIERSRHE